MKKIIMLLCLGLWSIWASAQGGNAGRSPAGERSGPEREGGGGKNGGGGGETKTTDKPGKSTVSADAVKTAEVIKSTNSKDGKGNDRNETQRAEAERQMNDQKIQAAADKRSADVKFFEQEQAKLKKN